VAVYFVYRCDQMGPSDLHRRRFDDATVLDWFRRHWVSIADEDEAAEQADAVLGVDLFNSFYPIFLYACEHPAPATIEEVCDALGTTYYDTILYEDHCVQVLTNDDQTDMAYYFFDDVFVARHPELTAFLLHDGPLPDGARKANWKPADREIKRLLPRIRRKGKGRVYVVPQIRDGSSLYDDLGPNTVERLEGLRVPDVCRVLMTSIDEEAERWGWHTWTRLRRVLLGDGLGDQDQERAFVGALQAQPDDEATWRAYADWLMENGGPSPGCRLLRLALPRTVGFHGGDPGRNVVRAGEHVFQASFHEGGDGFAQLIAFDDLWGGAHPALADALLRYGSRWYVLSTGDERML
jgi:uncharacterized protein (TIGR02996 family)